MDSSSLASSERRLPPWTMAVLLAAAAGAVWLAAGHWAALLAVVASAIHYLRDAGPGWFFLGMALLPAVGFPLLPFSLAAGPVFGPTLGAPTVIGCAILAVMVNVALSYWMADQALRPFLARLTARFGYRLPVVTDVGAWQITTIARLAPGLPFCAQSYLLGLVRVPFPAYLVMSTLIPAAYLTAIILGGDALGEGRIRPLLVAAGLLGGVGAVTHLFRRHQAQKRRNAALPARPAGTSDAPGGLSLNVHGSLPPDYSSLSAAVNTAIREARPHAAAGKVRFGGEISALGKKDGQPVLNVALPVIAGAPEEFLLEGRPAVATGNGFTLFRDGSLLAGLAVASTDSDLEIATGDLYRRLFAATDGWHLYRVWNYVPQINAAVAGLENYRRFCRGRSFAFEERFGTHFQQRLPAASAVGSFAGPLAIGFVAGKVQPAHFENPRQIPAFEYPREYGPRPPSFSRATVVDLGSGRRVYVSGTAAIRGHATVAADNLDLQLGCMIENLRLVGGVAGPGPDLGAGTWHRRFKVYLRHAEDLPHVQARLAADLLTGSDEVSYLQADICRAELLVEIEAVLTETA